MAKTIKLMYVDGLGASNNNKYYHMIDDGNGSNFTIEYGRVGSTKTVDTKPIGKWNSVYKEKTKKGYRDVTELFAESTAKVIDFSDISDSAIKDIINRLQAHSRKEIGANYDVSASNTTQKQVDEAQNILNGITPLTDVSAINRYLLDLYKVIPRKMNNVKQYLFESFDQNTLNLTVKKEQDLLDNMANQVKQAELLKDNVDDKATILDALGLELYGTDSQDVDVIKVKLDNLANKYSNSFKVVNKKTRKKFESFVETMSSKKTELFWHGSRNENWISILETGLILRPTNAVISGKMFGYGTYFADKAQKSYGYTSGLGSYWARGDSPEAYMALFNVHVGNQYVVETSDSTLDETKLKSKGDYHSTFAKAGRSLMNNEYIVYNQNQSDIAFLVQLKDK